MSYYDLSDEEQKRLELAGVDYDIRACLEYNPQGFEVSDIEKVMATWEGENDGDDWRWIIKLSKTAAKDKAGRYLFLQGGCDYTGWDCQSWATHEFATTAKKAALFALGKDVTLKGSEPYQAGVGHMLSLLSGEYMSNAKAVYESLINQLCEGKKTTWRESKDAEFGLGDLPKRTS